MMHGPINVRFAIILVSTDRAPKREKKNDSHLIEGNMKER